MTLASPPPYDLAIVGGGIVGLATALAVIRRSPGKRLLLIEKESVLASHQTGHNSGVIHSGLYYQPGSLKALNCVSGREQLYRFCTEHGVPFERCGKLVVATRREERPALDELERWGRANGLSGIRRITPEEAHEIEPHVACLDALHVPETGIVDFRAVSEAYARIIRKAGVEIRLKTAIESAREEDTELIVETSGGEIRTRALINCAGLQSDRVARACGVEPRLRILPFRGEYFELTENAKHLVRDLIYPVPDPRFPFLGVHFTRMIGGGIEAGPNALLALHREGYARRAFDLSDTLSMMTYAGFWQMSARYWRMGLGEMVRSWSRRAYVSALQKLIPALSFEDVKPAGCGIRAQAVMPDGRLVDDFQIIRERKMIHVLNAPSPAATASLAIGESVADMAQAQDFL